MSFWSEIAQKVGFVGGYSTVNFNGKALYVEGAGKVVSVERDKIEVTAGGALISVVGESLTLDEVSDGGVIIKGRILGETAVQFNKKR